MTTGVGTFNVRTEPLYCECATPEPCRKHEYRGPPECVFCDNCWQPVKARLTIGVKEEA